MDNLISTIVFILPGFMAYYWIQMFGQTPVVKHSVAEFAAVSALLWVPVTSISVSVLNLFAVLTGGIPTWSISALSADSASVVFAISFTVMNAISSFCFSFVWVRFIQKYVDEAINHVRNTRKLAKLAESTSVWDEFFIRFDEGETEKKQVLVVHKLGDEGNFVVGSMTRASRPFEADRAIVLEAVDKWMESYTKHYDFPVKRVYIDMKSGIVAKELDNDRPTPKGNPTA